MLGFWSRHCIPAMSLMSALAQRSVPAAKPPDFDLSAFDESPPTVPSSYWHDASEDEEDASRAS
jgi:hypothetical protein